MLTTILDAISSKDFYVAMFASFFGAVGAFLFEAFRSWKADRHKDLVAGNEAIFALAQMYSQVTNINNQLFLDQEKRVRELLNREPMFFEFMPIEVVAEQVPRVQLDKLLFVLRSHAPDSLHRLAAIDREFGVIMKFLEQRNEAQREFQRKTASAFSAGAQTATAGHLKALAGPELSTRLEKMTNNLRETIPGCAKDLLMLNKQMHNVLKYEFPFSAVTGFDAIGRDRDFLPPPEEKPRLWRRVARWLSQIGRRRVRLFWRR